MSSLDNMEFEEDGKFKDVPEGVYTVEITQAMVNTLEDVPKINWEFKILEGVSQNMRLWLTQNITPKARYFINRNLAPFGLLIDKPTDIPTVLAKVLGKKCKVNREINMTYKNPNKPQKIYYNMEIIEDLGDSATKISHDEIPF